MNKKEMRRFYYEYNIEKNRKYCREYYKNHKNDAGYTKKKKEYNKKYREKHREEINFKRRQRYYEEYKRDNDILREKEKYKINIYRVEYNGIFEFGGTITEICVKYGWKKSYAKWLCTESAHNRMLKRKIYLEEEE